MGVFMSPVIHTGEALSRDASALSSFKRFNILLIAGLLVSGASSSTAATHQQGRLTLNDALKIAADNDPWLSGSLFEQQSMEAKAVSAYQLPDPKLSFALANLPTDSFDFGQEAMTQLVVGVSQMYPRGDTRQLKREQLLLQGAKQPLLRQERVAKVTLMVTQLWLDAYQARESVKLIEQDMSLFNQLVDISMASYSTALGQVRQQNLIEAQLERIRIEDRLTKLLQKKESAEQALQGWLIPTKNSFAQGELVEADYDSNLPTLPSAYAEQLQGRHLTTPELARLLTQHPLVQAMDQNVEIAGSGVKLAKQKYKPEWGVSMSYGYRAEDANGRDRADLLSAAVSVSMPLFSSTSQDHEVESAVASQEKIRTERSLLIRNLISEFQTAKAQIERLDQRQQLFSKKLLPQVKRQAEATLNAYESDNGSFTEVVRSRIGQLNARIEYLDLKVMRLKQIAQLNYLLTTTRTISSENTGATE